MRKVKKTDGCWIWRGGITRGGYGRFSIFALEVYAHRAAYEILRGRIPEGMIVCHKCDQPRCVNPDHLWLGTTRENIQDKISKGRHVFGENNHNAKLDRKSVLKIRRLFKQGNLNQRQMAIQLGVTTGAVHHVAHGINWKHVK